MFKKVLIAVVAVAVGLGAIRFAAGRKAGCCGTEQVSLKQRIKNGWQWLVGHTPRQGQEDPLVSAQKEIEKLRGSVADLDKEDDLYFDKVAGQQIEAQERKEKLKKDQERLDTLKARITDLRVLIEDGKKSDLQKVSYKGIDYTHGNLQKQLTVDYDSYKPLKGSVESQVTYLLSLEANLAQNKEKLEGLKKRRLDMLTQLQKLEKEVAELKEIKASQGVVVDDGKYGKAQQSINALKKKLAVEREKLKLKGGQGKGPVEQAEESRDREAQRKREMDAEFGPTRAAVNNK